MMLKKTRGADIHILYTSNTLQTAYRIYFQPDHGPGLGHIKAWRAVILCTLY